MFIMAPKTNPSLHQFTTVTFVMVEGFNQALHRIPIVRFQEVVKVEGGGCVRKNGDCSMNLNLF